VRFLQDPLEEVVVIGGLRCTPVLRAAFDAMRLERSVRSAVVVMDMTAAAHLALVSHVRAYVRGRPGWRGVPQVRAALELADDHSASPPETRLRLMWLLDARLPRPLVNQPVFDATGRLLGYPDLFDPLTGLVAEYDGDDHRHARRHSRDVDREAWMRDAGLEVTRFTAADLADTDKVVGRLLAARRRSALISPGLRRWTLEPPPWWRPR
jgi:hypothetical protein